jgi:hypothetical protein
MPYHDINKFPTNHIEAFAHLGANAALISPAEQLNTSKPASAHQNLQS